jgi:hypothetical protein
VRLATSSRGGASAAAARNSTPCASWPKGTQLAKSKPAKRLRSCSRSSNASASGSQAAANSFQGKSAFSTLMALCFSSGCLDVGQ